LRQSRCTAAGCRDAQGPLPQIDPDPIYVDVDGRVLVAAPLESGGGLRIRVASVEQLWSTDDSIVVDDGDHGGLAVRTVAGIFVRGNAAVVLASSPESDGATYAVRVDATGAFRAIESR
jgi:hypothetical protein